MRARTFRKIGEIHLIEMGDFGNGRSESQELAGTLGAAVAAPAAAQDVDHEHEMPHNAYRLFMIIRT